ncbi:hypothetical protein N7491_009217 [Penicillium cf. griseofulvum]|uniref:Uncharacterized protein n=1 Tax=Penicillium cf. griseofulvum TaxID=2972120 RepID=A0A9W9JQ46_9EURO|nr:hypothetical protein N7472_005190 [Penicillium cf. griseofulvum]KAJ5424001.1 hypothetical protein N7491_009217 [Penicillium cf. griseofulvum]
MSRTYSQLSHEYQHSSEAECGYMPELTLAKRSHRMQSAEMNNQPAQLALVSSRYTMQTVDGLSLIWVAHLYIIC